jgi:hypothetical protein
MVLAALFTLHLMLATPTPVEPYRLAGIDRLDQIVILGMIVARDAKVRC